MIIEDYVSYEVAKLLKEKGFNGRVTAFVEEDNTKYDYTLSDFIKAETLPCPTHQMAMKWLREVHRKYIDIRYNNQNEEYRFIVFTMVKDKPIDFIHSEYHSTYEEAVEAALKYCLTELV